MCLEMFCKFFEKQVSIICWFKKNQLSGRGETSLILVSSATIRMCSSQNYYQKVVKVYDKDKCAFMTPNMLLSKCTIK